MIPKLDHATGYLPVGRYPATVSEVEAQFVTGRSPRRSEVWGHWQQATELLRSHVEVLSAWIGGSFLSVTDEPDDIDCVYWVEDLELSKAGLNPDSHAILGAFARQKVIRQTLELRVDTFLVPWHCQENLSELSSDYSQVYYRQRGYWDDFWQRRRSGGKYDPPRREDALPRRGYLEVMLDGYR